MTTKESEDKLFLSNIRKFYWNRAFTELGFFLPIIVLFWQSRGLSMTEIMVLQSIFAVAIVALEIPTGYFADIFSRKKSLIIGGFFFIFAYVFYIFALSYWQFIIIEILFALGIALRSGADSAFLYDHLKAFGKEKDYQRIFGKSYFYSLLILAATNIIGGFVGSINYLWTFMISIPFIIIAIIIALTFKEPVRHKMLISKNYVSDLLKVITHNLKNNARLRWIIIFAAIIYGFNQSALWLYQPYFTLTGLDVMYFGIVFASFQVVAALASRYAHKIEEFFGMKNSLFIIALMVSASFLLMGNFIFLFSFTFGFLQQSVRGFYKVVFSDYVNKLADSSVRATILSVQNMFSSLLYAMIIPFIGVLVDAFSLKQALILNGIFAAIALSSVLIVLHRKKLI